MNSRVLSILLFLFAFSPAIWMSNYMAENAVDAGCWDDWENGPLLKKWHEGTLTFKDLYAPQIQHRIVFPRLLIIGLTYLGDGDFRPQQYFALFLSVVSAVLLWVLLRRALGESLWVYGITFAANLLLFTPMHYQTYFWNSAMWMCIPIPCLLGALVILGNDKWPFWLKFTLAVVLAEVATHSFSQGMLLWPVLITYILLQPTLGSLKKRLIFAGVMAAIMGVTLACYFHDFYNTAWHAYNLRLGDHSLKGGVKLSDPGNFERVIRFFLGMFGALFARDPFSGHLEDDAKALGIYVFAPFIIACAPFLLWKQGRAMWSRALPVLALAAYAVGVALVVSVGRAHLGEHRCVLPRYFTMTQYVPVATIALAFLLIRQWLGGSSLAGWPREVIKRSGLVLLVLFCAYQWHLYQHGLHLARVWNNGRLTGQAITLFINQPELYMHPEIPEQPGLKEFQFYKAVDMRTARWDIEDTREAVNTIRGMGFSSPKVLETAELKHFVKDKREFGADKALIETVKVVKDVEGKDQIVIQGNARLGSDRPASLLLFTAPGSDKVVALGVPTPKPILRLFPLDYEFNNPFDVKTGEPYAFAAHFPVSVIQQAGGRLDVWILNQEENHIVRLKQQVEMPPAPVTTAPQS